MEGILFKARSSQNFGGNDLAPLGEGMVVPLARNFGNANYTVLHSNF